MGARERVGPKWEERAHKEGRRGNMEEWLSAAWITGLQEGVGGLCQVHSAILVPGTVRN